MNVLLGEIFSIAGLLTLYRVDASFVLEEEFSDSLNQHFANLSQFNNTSCPFETSVMMQEVMSDLLEVTATNIQKEPSYRLPFIANCSVFFDSKIDQIICDTEFANVQTLLSYEGNMPLLATEASFLHKGNILKTSMVVGLEPIQHPQVLYWLYFKLPATQTASQTNLLSLTITPSITITDSNSGSRSTSIENSDSITVSEIETWSFNKKTTSESDSLLSISIVSESNTPLYSLSTSASHTGTSSRTLSQSSTQTSSSSLSIVLRETPSISGAHTASSSQTESSSQTVSHSLTQSNTLQLQNTTIWSSSAYADATNQTGRYVIVNPGVNATVEDTLTGLIWEQTVGGTSVTWSASVTVGSAQAYCQSLTKSGHSDWRVPNIVELQSLVDYTIGNPGITINATAFPSTPSNYFWASLIYVPSPTSAWDIRFSSRGYVQPDGTVGSTGYPVRCVRGSSYNPSTRYTDELGNPLNGGSTQVKDQVTGLIWQRSQASSPSTYMWSGALSYCSTTLTLGSQTWRLPTVKELTTIVDYAVYNPSINGTVFPSTTANYFWSSSPVAGVAGYAWVVYFYSGAMLGRGGVSNGFYVRCVR